ncbi:metallophosphoesterase family protein [Methanocella arvoryzae]|uniref:Calcineurin-like phosphoesterase domain-containing protein n=1 Tax=Methanocella arvoryzae (strain DSM 22066 / NBRC 105507 / MRE50) TaxID=351160 RepID=Q0W559_METAR|nr:metallophosphoesterase [Methanocella arvoryzae]CAJ36484.1 hypothetical protein RCIX1166 [Methanocella arvoryzae MRE50]
MRGCTLLFSDIHADIGALDAILKVTHDPGFSGRFGPVERVLNLGDVVERGYHPCEVIDRLRSLHHLTSVMGNHDEAFICGSPVSGSDDRSETASLQCRAQGTWEGFLEKGYNYWQDDEARLFAAHGGPIDPEKICPGEADCLTAWLHGRTWQRISRDGRRYFDWSGYHYPPEDAFAAVRDALDPGFAILCGHEHSEAAYEEDINGSVTDVLYGLQKSSFTVKGRRIDEKLLPLLEGRNYLVRLGLAGPEGYYSYLGWDRSYFGVYYEKDGQRYISLLSFLLGRDMVPP